MRIGLLLMVFVSAAALGGCATVRTYSVDKERVDQNLAEGNQGYLMGQPKEPSSGAQRRLTRKTYVAEIEFGRVHKKRPRRAGTAKPAMIVEAVQELGAESTIKEETQDVQAGQVVLPEQGLDSYTVLPNDTLEKISLKVYGTSKRWKEIYEANSGQLKSPDKIYGGQVLKIPRD